MKKIIKNVLFTKGIADVNKVKVASVRNEHLIYSPGGSSNLYNHIKTNQFEKSIVTLDTQKNQFVTLSKSDLLFNQISDPDTHKKVLYKVDSLLKRSKKEIYCLNHPLKIFKTSRDNIYKLLYHIPGLIVPKTIKINPKSPQDIIDVIKSSNLKFPFLFRKAGDHGGVSTVKIESFEDVEPQMYPFALDGREYYLTEYYDYQDNGVYKKVRLVVVDGEVYIRHAIFSDNWMVHAGSKDAKYKEEEIKLLKEFSENIKPKLKQTIKKVHKILELEYFGIDCSIDKNMNLVVFEINANMNVMIGASQTTSQYVSKIKQAVVSMILKRLKD